jgi:cell fate regulator YaaT (PSP1 superfamily)
MEQTSETSIVGVRFSKVGKIYHFSAENVTDIKVSDMVVVETSRGWQLGQVAQILEDAQRPPEGWKPVDRRATPRDLLLRQMWQQKEAEVVSTCHSRANELHLVGIKIISAEYSFDGSRLTILFSSETEEKFDLKSLRQDMQKAFAPSVVEMRQIGPRDVAKVVCGMGACGLEKRCCCLFLTEFSSISIRMAKEQGISLTPSEITGMCGRLRCCLIYEYDNYVESRAKLPKRNKRVRTPQGEGKVVDVVPLRGSVIVDLPEVGRREFLGTEVVLADDSGGPAPQPFTGTQQPSEIDQAIVGDAKPEPFTISPQKPDEEAEDQPRTDAPSGGRQGQRPPRGRGERGRGGQQGESGSKGGQPPQGGGRQGQRPPRREGRPGGGQKGGATQGGPPGKPKGEAGAEGTQPPSGTPPRGGQPGGQPRGGREQRRRKGKRRDSSDSEN